MFVPVFLYTHKKWALNSKIKKGNKILEMKGLPDVCAAKRRDIIENVRTKDV